MNLRIAIDCGGTFTDVIAVDDQGRASAAKTPSTPEDFTIGVINTLVSLARKNKITLKKLLGQTSILVHGSTMGTNLLVQGIGPKMGLITTTGYRDNIELRQIPKKDMYNWRMDPPEPLVTRYLRMEVEERLNYRGEVVTPLNEDSVRQAVAYLKEEGVQAIAVVLLFSFLNPAHERRIAEIIREDYPEVSISLSSVVLPAIGEFERTSTTLINTFVAPTVSKYIEKLQNVLEKEGFKGQLLLMQNNGGVETAEIAKEQPATVISGDTAAGPQAANSTCNLGDKANIITMDMGGTSLDCGMIYQGTCPIKTDSLIADTKFALPSVDVTSIGAGGGSIAWFDSGGCLHVGPRSAAAVPGPACYGKEGEEATVTDADVVLGYINPDYFLGGEMKLSKDLAEKAVEEKVADRLGLSLLEAAAGIYKITNSCMADLVSYSLTEHGYDPRDFTMCFAGSAGPVHAVRISQELGITRLFIPKIAPVFLPYGMLSADLKHDYTRFYYVTRQALDMERVKKLYQEMEAEAFETLEREGISEDQRILIRSMKLRYYGQFRELEVSWDSGPISNEAIDRGIAAFHTKHKALYGYSNEKYPIEFMYFQLSAYGKLPYIEFQKINRGTKDPSPALKSERDAYFEEYCGMVKTKIYDGDKLLAGNVMEGPCIVEEKMTTVVIPPKFRMMVDDYGNYVSYGI